MHSSNYGSSPGSVNIMFHNRALLFPLNQAIPKIFIIYSYVTYCITEYVKSIMWKGRKEDGSVT